MDVNNEANSYMPNSEYLIRVGEIFAKKIGYLMTRAEKSSFIWEEIRGFYNEDIRRYWFTRKKGPNIYKKVAFVTFWIRKLKPFQPQKSEHRFINEIFALYFSLMFISARLKPKKLYIGEQEFVNLMEEIIHTFRYSASSPYVIALMLGCLWKNDKIT